MSEECGGFRILARHLETCPVCSTLDDDGNERVCRAGRELARLVVREHEQARQEEYREEISTLLRRQP
jgi:hypothetical protein